MRILTPSPPPQRRLPLVTTPRPAGSSPPTTTSSSTPESASSTDIPPAPAPASPLHSSNTPATSSHKAEDSSEEISTLKNEITRLNNEMRSLLDHAIDIQCDLPVNESSSEPITTRTYTEVFAQCDLKDQRAVRRLKGAVEVLEAESHCLKLQLKSCKCAEQSRQPWTVIRSKADTSPSVTTRNKFELFQTKNTETTDYSLTSNSRQNEKHKPQKHRLPLAKHNLNLQSILIRGDSHTRHIAGLTRGLIDSSTSCLLTCLQTRRTPTRHCQPVSARTSTYEHCRPGPARNLQQYITNRPADTQLVVATMPHRYDPDNPIHDETMLVNAFIEELAARHDIQVLRLDTISRKYFTRHGLHLSMRGKRLLAEMLLLDCQLSLYASTVRRQSGSSGSATTGTDVPSITLTSLAFSDTFGASVFTVVSINVRSSHSAA
ncbi:hypothetical protein J6590_101925 [Homalodisca vitripennis]|nr:hypothetical protein J6590_101925 [Homalodisca vitripennis]